MPSMYKVPPLARGILSKMSARRSLLSGPRAVSGASDRQLTQMIARDDRRDWWCTARATAS
jgi:hypothetical protein